MADDDTTKNSNRQKSIREVRDEKRKIREEAKRAKRAAARFRELLARILPHTRIDLTKMGGTVLTLQQKSDPIGAIDDMTDIEFGAFLCGIPLPKGRE